MAKPAHTGTIAVGPIPRARMSARLADALREYVATSHLRPGDRLPPERSLAAAFAVSRSVVREALRGLEADGWVSIDHGRGIFVGDRLNGIGLNGNRANSSEPRQIAERAERDRQFA